MLKKIIIVAIILIMTGSFTAYASSSDRTPLRYREQPRNLKHAGAVIHRNNSKTSMINLNYNTGKGFNYNTGAFSNYTTRSGLNYNTGTHLRYR